METVTAANQSAFQSESGITVTSERTKATY